MSNPARSSAERIPVTPYELIFLQVQAEEAAQAAAATCVARPAKSSQSDEGKVSPVVTRTFNAQRACPPAPQSRTRYAVVFTTPTKGSPSTEELKFSPVAVRVQARVQIAVITTPKKPSREVASRSDESKFSPVATRMKTPIACPTAPVKARGFTPARLEICNEILAFRAIRANGMTTLPDGSILQLSQLGAGKFKITYRDLTTFQQTGRRELIKVYNNDTHERCPSGTILKEYTALQMHQYNLLRGEVPVARILNDPARDGYFRCEEIIASSTYSLPKVIETYFKNASAQTMKNWPKEVRSILDQLAHFFFVAVSTDTPMDAQPDNFIINDSVEAILIDFYELRQDYRGHAVERIVNDSLKDQNPCLHILRGLNACSGGNQVIFDYLIARVAQRAQKGEKLFIKAYQTFTKTK